VAHIVNVDMQEARTIHARVSYPAALSGGGRSNETRRSRDGAEYRRARDVAMPTARLAHLFQNSRRANHYDHALALLICAAFPVLHHFRFLCIYTTSRELLRLHCTGIQVEILCCLEPLPSFYSPFSPLLGFLRRRAFLASPLLSTTTTLVLITPHLLPRVNFIRPHGKRSLCMRV
jgi:hypothetical protein